MQASRLPRSLQLRVGALTLLLGLIAFIVAPAAQAASGSVAAHSQSANSAHLVPPGHAVQHSAVAHRVDSPDVTIAANPAVPAPVAASAAPAGAETNSSATADTARGRGPPVEA